MKSHKVLLLVLAAWAAAAALFAASGAPGRAPGGAIPIVVFGLAVVALLAVKRVRALRESLQSLRTGTLLVANLFRFVGIAFLVLQARGELPADFAQRAGWGDIAAAIGALALLLWPRGASFRGALIVWNIFGALDLFVAVGTAAWLNRVHPGSMATMVRLPFALVPLWAVPVLLTAHAELLRRTRRGCGNDARNARDSIPAPAIAAD